MSLKDTQGEDQKLTGLSLPPIEDNRYALSLAGPSNILVTTDGGKILNFFGSLSDTFESREIFNSISPYLPKDLAELCLNEIGAKNFP